MGISAFAVASILAAAVVAVTILSPSRADADATAIATAPTTEPKPRLIVSGDSGSMASPDAATLHLPDVAFDLQVGYGYVGGTLHELPGAHVVGGALEWPVRWRSGVERYVIRLPRGRYVVELTTIEVELAGRGLRVFDVIAEGKTLFGSVDPFELVGDFHWLTLSGEVSVHDGWLDLELKPKPESQPPCLARLRISPRREAESDREPAPGAPRLEATGAVDSVVLRWSPHPEHGTSREFWILRSTSPEGPFRSLSNKPIHGSHYVDGEVEAGTTYYYQLQYQTAFGRQSEFSAPHPATPIAADDAPWPIYRFYVDESDLSRIGLRHRKQLVPARLFVDGELYHTLMRYDHSPSKWQRKKSYVVRLDATKTRSFQRRRRFYLSAEAGDASFSRQLLSTRVAGELGLKTPGFKPVLVFVNDRLQGVYLDREKLGTRFRRRVRLESRNGLLIRPGRLDHLALDWEPYGNKVGQPGRLDDWTYFVHALHRIGSGEIGDFLSQHLYWDRWVDRSVLWTVGGESKLKLRDVYFLEDARNRRWERFRQEFDSDQWGLRDFASQPQFVDDAAAAIRRSCFRPGVGGTWTVLETRLWNHDGLRRRYLRRLLELLDTKLAVDRVASLADELFRSSHDLVAMDPLHFRRRDADVADAAVLAERFRAAYEERVDRLRAASSAELASEPSGLRLSEILLRPTEGPAWIELENRSPHPIDLGEFALGTLGGTDSYLQLPRRLLAPGEFLRQALTSPATYSPSGGTVALHHVGSQVSSPGAATLVDLLFYGHQSSDLSYGRLAAGGAWGYLARATPAATNDDRRLRAPHYTFRAAVEEQSAERLELSISLHGPDNTVYAAAEAVEVQLRASGAKSFTAFEMVWQPRRFRFVASIDRGSVELPADYYFLARTKDGVEQVYPLVAPDLTYRLVEPPGVWINEVLPRPDRASGQREFIEIFNATDQTVDLGGYFLSDDRDLPRKWRIPSKTQIAPGDYYVVVADDLDSDKVDGREHTNFSLSNSGEFLGLYSRASEGSLLVDSIVFRATQVGKSWGREPGRKRSSRQWKDPTPGAKNLPKIPNELLEK